MALTQTLRVAVTLNPGAVGRERFMNTWHIATRDATTPATAAASFVTDLNTFYQAIDAYFSGWVDGVVPLVQVYNLIENKPRQPILETSLSTITAAANRAPRELSVVVSYRATYSSGISPKRRRGRIYLGPMSDSTFDSTTGMVASAAVTAISNAANLLQAQSGASSEYAWVVYSPTTDTTGTGEVGMYECIGGWVDSSPDIQRRRGVDTSTRTAF